MRAKLFKNGRSQAVRLPREFRFEGDEVEISREGDVVMLRPVKQDFSATFWDALGGAPDLERPEQGGVEDRPRL